MGISETILAAGIGGAATVMAGFFQLYTALRVKAKADSRRKPASMTRSMISIAALMATSAAGGYLFAEYRQQRALDEMHTMRDELRGMRDELNERLQTLETAEHLVPQHVVVRPAGVEPPAASETPAATDRPSATQLALSDTPSAPPPAAAQ